MPKIGLLDILISCSASLLLSLILTPAIRKLALRINAVDKKEEGRRNDGIGMPRLGGLGICLAFALTLLLNANSTELTAILAGTICVFIVGIIDDVRGAPVWLRLGVEFTAACLVYIMGIGIDSLPNPFGAPIELGWLSLPVTVIWIVVITNAINLIDGLDGLAAGTSILILVAILLLNWQVLPGGSILAAFALIGALAGFLVFNFPPASIYMGDSGSLFLGFFLSTFAIVVSRENAGSFSLGVMILAFSLPLLDMMYAVLRRWYRGMSIYKADKDHLHHKLLQKGFSKRQVLSWFYGANLLLLIALFLLFKVDLPRPQAVLILIVLSLAAFWGFQLLSDLKPSDFAKKIGLLFGDFKKRRFHLYLINRFERQTEKEKDFTAISGHLDELFRDYRFSIAEIERHTGKIYAFSGIADEMNSYSLEFPIIKDNGQIANVRLRKPFAGGPIYCSGELALVLSACLRKVLKP